jgi:cell division protein FtsI (penicillin-binding protein 3)
MRTVFIFFLFTCLFTLALVNLFYLQIRRHSFFIDLGNKQYQTTISVHPPRALIYDRNNKPLALNKDSLAAFILPKQLKEPALLKQFLQTHFPAAAQRLRKKPQSNFLYIKRKLTPEEIELIKASNLADLNILKERNRFYPIESAGSITGITNIDNNGLFGIELLYDQQLTGTPTTTLLQRDARSGHFYFSKETKETGTEGTSVKLTIDGDLQFLVQEELNAQAEKFQVKEGAAVVMNPETGEILAMATYPTFDPHDTRELEIVSTKNTALTEQYEFGSAIKAFTALAALEEEVVEPGEMIDCQNTRTAYVEGRRINNWEAQGSLTFEDVIVRSNNIGIAKVAKRLDTKLYDHFKRLGFDTKTGINFPGEQSGFINPPENWSKQSIISLSYGYEVSPTLLQMTRAFSVFLNNGYLMQPKLILEPEVYQKTPEKIYSDESISTMRRILERTTSKQGTAKYAAIKGYTTFGKTSTANLIVNGKYDETKNMYGFLGGVEKGNYKRVIGCFLKESPRKNLFASTVAAPLFRKIVEKLLIHSHVLAGDSDEVNYSGNRTTG